METDLKIRRKRRYFSTIWEVILKMQDLSTAMNRMLQWIKKTHILRKPTIFHSQSQIGRVLQKFYQRLPFVPQHLRSTSVGILVSGPADGMGEGAVEMPHIYIYICI